MDRTEIIKALECCVKVGGYRDAQICNDCPLSEKRCAILLPENALALINSQEQRIKELTAENERLRARRTIDEKFKYCNLVGDSLIYNKTLEDYNKLRADFRADTVMKMRKRLTLEFDRMHKNNFMIPEVRQWIIDQIAKEMLEGEK